MYGIHQDSIGDSTGPLPGLGREQLIRRSMRTMRVPYIPSLAARPR